MTDKKWEDHARKIPNSPCCCVGPQNGQPLCPCRMKNVVVRNGRYVLPETDLGPASPTGGTRDDR